MFDLAFFITTKILLLHSVMSTGFIPRISTDTQLLITVSSQIYLKHNWGCQIRLFVCQERNWSSHHIYFCLNLIVANLSFTDFVLLSLMTQLRLGCGLFVQCHLFSCICTEMLIELLQLKYTDRRLWFLFFFQPPAGKKVLRWEVYLHVHVPLNILCTWPIQHSQAEADKASFMVDSIGIHRPRSSHDLILGNLLLSNSTEDICTRNNPVM